jgi:hypothetical protein
MDYAGFDDFWGPIAAGEGPLGAYVIGLDSDQRRNAMAAVKRAYEGGAPDGPRSFAASAWACRGRVP